MLLSSLNESATDGIITKNTFGKEWLIMKKIISVFLAAVILFGTGVYSMADTETINVDNSFFIVYADNHLETIAEKCSNYIEEVTGYVLPTASESSGPSITIETEKRESGSGYVISSDSESIVITGSSLQWTVRGVYSFLEEYGGIRVYTSEKITYTSDKIQVPCNLREEYSPYFEYTDTDWLSPRDTEYSLFNGLNSAENRNIPSEMGGSVDYISSFGHSLTNQFCSRDKYYEDHPEYFSLYRGIRTDQQLCLSNPNVLEIVKQEVFDLLKEKHDPEADLQIVSLTQHDNIFFCSCDKCRATDKKYGSHAGSLLEFVNAVARDVKAAGYENVAIDTFAYQYTRKPPVGIVPEDNVIIRLCSFECCFSHPLNCESCSVNKSFMDDFEGWSKICSRIYVWDYCTDFCNYTGLFPNFGVLQENIQTFAEHNVKGVYEEGNYSMKAEGEFGELRSYMISRLLKDPYCDIVSLRNEFIDDYYGNGGKHIADFLDIITENAPVKHLGIYQSMTDVLSLSPSQVKECDRLWENAKQAAEGEHLRHVLGSEISWRWWKMKNHRSEFLSPVTYSSEKENLMNDISSAGIDRLNEMGNTKAFFCYLYEILMFRLTPLAKAVFALLYAV